MPSLLYLLPTLLMVQASFSYLLSRSTSSSSFAARRLAALSLPKSRAFSAVANGPSVRAAEGSSRFQRSSSSEWPRSSLLVSTASRRLLSRSSATVEEDLDAALEDILGSAAAASKTAPPPSRRSPPKVNPANLNLDEEDDEEDLGSFMSASEDLMEADFEDPTVLAVDNPRWAKMGLKQSVVDVLTSKGIDSFTPVQGEAFGPVLAGRDVIGRSRTGTGKTLAFGIPSLLRLLEITRQSGKRDDRGRMRRGRLVSMLVLCPTRELARQVQDQLNEVAKPLGLYVDVFHGGVSYDPQSRALQQGIDVLVGTPGRIIDHMQRGNLDLRECEIVVLDEADEMLNMGFAEDVEVVLQDVGVANERKTQCLLFSATTPSWVKQIAQQYQEENVITIDATSNQGGARVANTVRHLAIKLPPGVESKKAALEDIIAVEISRDVSLSEKTNGDSSPTPSKLAASKKSKTNHAMQQQIFGKTIVFTETKRMADDLVSGGVFKSLTAQALHGDVGQKQRDSTLNAFRAGAFNVLVATDVAARGIDIQDVDLVIQFDPPRDVDTYVHRSGRTGRAGNKGISVLLFSGDQSRDIVRIERDLGHGFKFDLTGPPSVEATLKAAAKTSAIACRGIPDETAAYFKESAAALLAEEGVDPKDVIARCLAAISRRSTEVQRRSLITGEVGYATVEMSRDGSAVTTGDVMYMVNQLSRMSRKSGGKISDDEEDSDDADGDFAFDSEVGKIQVNRDSGTAIFDMAVDDAKKLVEFSQTVDSSGFEFSMLEELEVERGRFFGERPPTRGGRGGGRDGRFGGGGGRRDDGRRFRPAGGGGGRGSFNGRSERPQRVYGTPRGNSGPYDKTRGYNDSNRGGGGGGRRNDYFDRNRSENRRGDDSSSRGGFQRRYDSRGNNGYSQGGDDGW